MKELVEIRKKPIKKFNSKGDWVLTAKLYKNNGYWSIHRVVHEHHIDPETIPSYNWKINVGSEKYVRRLWKK